MRGVGKIVGYVVHQRKFKESNWTRADQSRTLNDCYYYVRKYGLRGFAYKISRIRKIDDLKHLDPIVELPGNN